MFSGFQSNAYQNNAYQISNDNSSTPGGRTDAYVTPWQRYKAEEYQRKLLHKEKSELEKVNNVILETQRQADLVAKNLLLAEKKAAQERLAKKEQEFLNEINRLLLIRDQLIKRIKQEEQTLFLLIMMRKRRLRAI